MILLPLSVVGPLSECSTEIRVEGQLTKSEVQILSNGNLVAKGTATSASQVFPLLPNISLHAGEKIVAVQTLAGSNPSKPSPKPVIVQSKPPQVGPVVFTHPIYTCGVGVWITGAVPGAAVQVTVTTAGQTNVRGTGTATNGSVGIYLNKPTGSGEILTAQHTACGIPGVDTEAPPAEPPGDPLPKPKIVKTPLACQRTVAITNILPGAVVSLKRTNSPTQTGWWVADIVHFPVDPPLIEGEDITVQQAFPSCELTSASVTVKVKKSEPIPSPIVSRSLCAGASTVLIGNLLPGSQIRILSHGQEIGVAEAPDKAVYPFSVSPKLTAGSKITAQQELCGKWSAPSNTVVVAALPGHLPKPSIPGPLVECAGVVHVKNVQPGTWVDVWSEKLEAPIGSVYAGADHVDVQVNPCLLYEDNIYAEVVGCGETSTSDPVSVDSLGNSLDAPSVLKPVEQMTAVPVGNVVPGAVVDIFVNNKWRGSKLCTMDKDSVPLWSGKLAIHDSVKARQRMCILISPFGEAISTLPFPPKAAFSANPTSGTVPLTVQFANQSSGYQLNSWEWDFGDGGTSTVFSPSYQYTDSPGGTYHVKLTVGNEGGKTSISKDITVLPVAPSAGCSANPTSGTSPLAVQFTDQSTGVITFWKWDFGDGGTSTAQNPSHVYDSGGTYNATLTVSNKGGLDSCSMSIQVQAAPEVPVTPVISATTQFMVVVGDNLTPLQSRANRSIELTVPAFCPSLWVSKFGFKIASYFLVGIPD